MSTLLASDNPFSPRQLLVLCNSCGSVFGALAYAQPDISAPGVVTMPELADARWKLPCGHWVGVRGVLNTKPLRFYRRRGDEWEELEA